jgi:hypothetical protein
VCLCVCVLRGVGSGRASRAKRLSLPLRILCTCFFFVLLVNVVTPTVLLGSPPSLHAWVVCERNEKGGWASTPVMTMASAAMLLRAVVALLALSSAHGQNWYFNCNETLFDNPAMSCAGLLILCNTGNVCRHITPFTCACMPTPLFAHMEPTPPPLSLSLSVSRASGLGGA